MGYLQSSGKFSENQSCYGARKQKYNGWVETVQYLLAKYSKTHIDGEIESNKMMERDITPGARAFLSV